MRDNFCVHEDGSVEFGGDVRKYIWPMWDLSEPGFYQYDWPHTGI